MYVAVGRHSRIPRRYRDRDIFWWLDQIGALDRSIDEVRSPADAPHEPSLQLVGRADASNVDLPTLASAGVVLLGRLRAIDGDTLGIADLRGDRRTAVADEAAPRDRLDGVSGFRRLRQNAAGRAEQE